MPAWALVLVVAAFPVGYAVAISLTDRRLGGRADSDFVWLDNYSDYVFDATFVGALGVTALFVAAGLILQFGVGYFVAEALVRPLRAAHIFRTSVLVPMLLTPVAVGLMWRFLFNPDLGFITWLLSLAGINGVNVFGDVWLARGAVILVDSWMNIPFVSILLLAGLLSVPHERLEAAAIDGASSWQTRRFVLIPSIRLVIAVGVILRFIGLFNLFDVVFAVTQGGPGRATQNLPFLAYEQAFENRNLGVSASVAIAMALLTIPAFLAFLRLIRKSTLQEVR